MVTRDAAKYLAKRQRKTAPGPPNSEIQSNHIFNYFTAYGCHSFLFICQGANYFDPGSISVRCSTKKGINFLGLI